VDEDADLGIAPPGHVLFGQEQVGRQRRIGAGLLECRALLVGQRRRLRQRAPADEGESRAEGGAAGGSCVRHRSTWSGHLY
jgi:hypothetical protein